MPVDLLSQNNICGQALVQLVSRANAIIAELLRLSEFVPTVFRLETKLDIQKYGDIVHDFSYFKNADAIELKIEANPVLVDADDEFRENYSDILSRFYVVFESVHRFGIDFNRFIEELEDGFYIQQNIESVMLNNDGKQLLVEGLYLFGVVLLMLDQKLDGVVRERLLISYYRYSAESTHGSNIDDVCRLLRSTGYSAGSKKPQLYPENYFARLPFNKIFIDVVIGHLRSDDIYNQLPAYPLPEHRSIALSGQAAMLFVCLYFSPDILQNQTAVMREIVDKFFPDNWVVSIYMGLTVNLVEAWDQYRAAKMALSNSLDATNIKSISNRYGREIHRLNAGLVKVLQEGTLSAEYILDNSAKLMNTVRNCNAALRWLILHTAPSSAVEVDAVKRCKTLFEQVKAESKVKQTSLFEFLLNTSMFEQRLKEQLKKMLADKEAKWGASKQDASIRLKELSDVFSGVTPLSRVDKNEKLQKWFSDISEKVSSLDFNNTQVTGKQTVQIVGALEEVQEFHNLGQQLQVRQFLDETRNILLQMVRTLGMQDEMLVHMQIAGDLSYAFTIHMQEGIKEDPSLAVKLRATFLKLSSALDLPLLRIQQASSPDMISVSEYYSSELVLYIRKVLQIIPETVFYLLSKIITLQTQNIKELPTRLDKSQMKEYAQLDHRYEVAKKTHAISVLTEGALAMRSTLVGVIKVDSKQLLEDGIRKELVRLVASAMHTTLTFNPKSKQNDLNPKLQLLAQGIDGFKRSFEYISDYVNLTGLKIWQEEFSRIVNFYVEQECNRFLRQKVQSWESIYQSKTIPIPILTSGNDQNTINFIGRLAKQLMHVTDPKTTVYIHNLGFWYDAKTHKECVNPQLWKLLRAGFSNIGLNGLDQFYSYMIQQELQQIASNYKRLVLGDKDWLSVLTTTNNTMKKDEKKIQVGAAKFYNTLTNRWNKSSLGSDLTDALLKIGQMQIIRIHIVRELSSSVKFESKLLDNALQTFNLSLLNDIKKHYRNPTCPYPKEENPLLFELATYLETSGCGEPLKKIYASLPPQEYFPLFVAISVLAQIPKFAYTKNIGLISKRPQDAIDGIPFAFGLVTLFQQFHSAESSDFVEYLAQYVRSTIEISNSSHSSSKPSGEFTPEAVCTLLLLHEFITNIDKEIETSLPLFLLESISTGAL